MVLVMHPEGMSLYKANLAGILTPGIKLTYWKTSSIVIAKKIYLESPLKKQFDQKFCAYLPQLCQVVRV